MSETMRSSGSRFFGHIVIEDFLDARSVAALLDYCETNERRFAPTTVQVEDGTRVEPSSRISLGLEDLGPWQKLLEDRFRAAEPLLREQLGIGAYDVADIELQIAAHNDGAFFRRHSDRFTGWGLDRVISAVYYFHRGPCGFTGGALRLYPLTGEGYLDVGPVHNRLVAFPSFVQHEVTRVACPSGAFMDSRFAINCWFRRAAKGAS